MSKETIIINGETVIIDREKGTYTTIYYIGDEECQITRKIAKSQEEHDRRMAVELALVNSELEGYKTPDDFRELMERVATGEITIEDVHRDTERKFAEFLVK